METDDEPHPDAQGLGVREVARRLNISVRSLRDHLKAGHIRYAFIGGKIVITLEEVRRILATGAPLPPLPGTGRAPGRPADPLR
jgi:excisionase family DNA binding protein